jgi:hypothetical protein
MEFLKIIRRVLNSTFLFNNNEEIIMSIINKQLIQNKLDKLDWAMRRIERLNRTVEILEERHEIALRLLSERDKIIQKYKDNNEEK